MFSVLVAMLVVLIGAVYVALEFNPQIERPRYAHPHAPTHTTRSSAEAD